MDDAQLVKDFADNRDEAAFARLVDRHGPMVLGICRRALRNSADADDAFQATFLLLATRAKQIREPLLIGNWLFGVATRTAIGARRSASRRTLRERRLMRFLSKPRSETDDADLRLTIDEQVQRLPENLRQVVVCYYLQELTTREAAEQLQWPESTVMARLKKARELLKARLSRRGLSVSDATVAAVLATVVVPTVLRAATVTAGNAVAAGQLGVASAKAAALAKATGSGTASAVKLKVAAAVLATTIVAVGATAVAVHSRAPEPAPAAVAVDATIALPPVVEKALLENEAQLDPIHIAWTTTYTSPLPPAEVLEKTKVNKGIFEPLECSLTWQNGKVFSTWRLRSNNDDYREYSFDGEISYLGMSFGGKHNSLSKQRNSDDVRHEKPRIDERGSGMMVDGFLQSVGLRAISAPRELAVGKAEPEMIALLAGSGKLVELDNITQNGVAIVRIRISANDPERAFADRSTRQDILNATNGMSPKAIKENSPKMLARWEAGKRVPEKRDYIFELDPAKNYAVVAREQRTAGQLISRTESSNFQQLPGRAVWLPSKIITSHYGVPDDPTAIFPTPMLLQEEKLTEMSFDPVPAEKFVLDYPEKGVMHFDRTKPFTGTREKSYPTTAASTATTKPVPGYQPLADLPAISDAPVERSSLIGWIAGAGLMVLGGAGFWIYRRRRGA